MHALLGGIFFLRWALAHRRVLDVPESAVADVSTPSDTPMSHRLIGV
ncbi:MAG: hypothetical protein IKO65_00525 [Victivallales bacterium]|nr:hypothetical protein [Victivallales bacterium]